MSGMREHYPSSSKSFEDMRAQMRELSDATIDIRSGVNCSVCHARLQDMDLDDPRLYREVTSWVNGPKLQSPVLREQTGALAHEACIKMLVNGQAADQETLEGLDG